MSACMITGNNNDDRQLKTEVAVFLDWSMTSDSYNCPYSSARENGKKKTNQSSFYSRVKKPAVIFQYAHKNLIARDLSHACRLSLAFSLSLSLLIFLAHIYLYNNHNYSPSFPLEC